MSTRFIRENDDQENESWAAKVVENLDPSRATFTAKAVKNVPDVGAASSDFSAPSVNNGHMNDITRHELDAKLEAIEARMDARVASIEGGVSSIRAEMQGFLAAQAERDRRFEERLEANRREHGQRFETLAVDINRLGNIKVNIWSAMVTTIIVLVAIGALALTAFQAGTVKPTPAANTSTQAVAPLQVEPTAQPTMPAQNQTLPSQPSPKTDIN